jgi:hypothetical protein
MVGRRTGIVLGATTLAGAVATSILACVNLDALSGGSAATPPEDSGRGAEAEAADGPAATSLDAYDELVLGEAPVAFWAMRALGPMEADLTGRAHDGSYEDGMPARATLPNGASVARFDGRTQHLLVPTRTDLSIATKGALTWEAWIRPDSLTFIETVDDYVNFLGKCASYSPTCEWAGRFYVGGRSITALAFNNGGGGGSGADWMPAPDLLRAGQWLHVVAEYQTLSTPSDCSTSSPGSIEIWVNGIGWAASSHRPRGCMSEREIVPRAASSPLVIGSVALDSFFAGAIGKVAIYDRLLSPAQIAAHFKAMTGADPSGSCAATCTVPVPTPGGP